MEKLLSYIAPSAPATRRPSAGGEPPLRIEIGFTPTWYRNKLGIDFGEIWHNNPQYRKDAVLAMRKEIKTRFPGKNIGIISNNPDLLTGTYGACAIAAIYGMPVVYSIDNWPTCGHKPLSDSEMNFLEAPGLDDNIFFRNLIKQMEWIEKDQGNIIGFMNWQGVLNNAHRLRGEHIFTDMYINPDGVLHLMNCVCSTMIEAAKRIQYRQKKTNVKFNFFTVSNCLVNMISPEQYRDFVMPFDLKISREFDTIGIHNCAWNADPYMEYYARIPNLGYIDMGINSDLNRAKKLFPKARRAIMYTPMDVYSKSLEQIKQDMVKIALYYSPCDIVMADIDDCVPDKKVIKLIEIANIMNLEFMKDK